MKQIIFLLLFFLFATKGLASEKSVKIGILVLRDKGITHQKWDATAKYLDDKIAGYRFEIVPLTFSEIDTALAQNRVDFLLVNSSIYVNMEYKYQIGRIATLKRVTSGSEAVSFFGGVIFTKSDRHDINTIEDLAGKHFVAVDYTSLGGWHMAWYKMKQSGFDPTTELESLSFGGTHDKVVYDILRGEGDAGTVRTGVLESMAREHKIKLSDIKVLSPQKCLNFNLLNSTPCYPEWPMAKLSNTPDKLANAVAIALISMDANETAAIAADIDGWTIPHNYQLIHELRKGLDLPPYDKKPEITLMGVFKKYWHIIILSLLIILVLLIATIRISSLNRKLQNSEMHIRENYEKLKNIQSKLVESEKMASLGGLVAGVSHEINTPVGLALTSITHLSDEFKILTQKYENGEMSEDDFNQFMSLYGELGRSIEVNLNRAVNLIRSFKQVAVDQSSEALREFNIKEYIHEVLVSLHNKTKKTKHHITLEVPSKLNTENYPGAFSQIITNLVMNSLVHGYNQGDEGNILIKIDKIDDDLVLIYKDDGKGISKENIKKIYDPFFTTNRENGGSGLGMNIIYNIVKQKLKGDIICNSQLGHGVEFKIIIPFAVENKKEIRDDESE
jgi:signal transduction histidine kinase